MTASSRLRCFVPHEQLGHRGISSVIGECPSAANVVVQKRVTPQTLDFAKSAKEQGSRIIYDVDDSGDALWYWAHPKLCFQMLKLADVVTTDTPERATWLTRTMPGLTTRVWSNPVDYSPQSPVRFEPVERERLRVLWFGSTSTASLLKRYGSAIASVPNVDLVVCTGADVELPVDAELVPWSKETFISTLQGCDLACLMHDGSRYDRMKSNHKMTTSICWGVPAIVSKTPDYERTAKILGVSSAVFADATELVSIIESLRSTDARQQYLNHTQPLVWQRHSPASSAARLLTIVEGLESHRPPKRESFLEKLNYARWWTGMSESRPAAIADLVRSFLNLQKS